MRLLGKTLHSHSEWLLTWLLLDFDHFEVFFTNSAFWAHPIIGYVVPASTRRDTVVRQT